MKSLYAKRIAAVAAGLLVGLAFAGQGLTLFNVPIINSAGTPVVQIVVGSGTQTPYSPGISDGVVAANIAAAIGSLAHTSSNITATVSGTSGVKCVVTTPTCTLSNQEVWLGEKGLVTPTGSYSFKALIGSVINGAVLNYNTLSATKSLQGSGSYSYPEEPTPAYAITATPTSPSPYTGTGTSPSVPASVLSGTNGGGVNFYTFKNSSGGTNYDNIVELTNGQVPSLQNNAGTYGESESLWLAGFPVYDQNISNFAVLDTQGAYELLFTKPIPVYTNGHTNRVGLTILGENWTIYNATPPKVSAGSITDALTAQTFVTGGNVTLAQSSTPIQRLNVSDNLTVDSGKITILLQDLSYVEGSSSTSQATFVVFNNGVVTNSSVIVSPGAVATVNSSGTILYIYVPQTFPGVYARARYANVQVFSTLTNVTSGKDFNVNNKNWLTELRWTTNQSTFTNFGPLGQNAMLEGLVLYSNSSSVATTLTPGQSFSYIQNPANWKVNFVGDTLGAPGSGNSNYDPLGISTGFDSGDTYSNPGTQSGITKYQFAGSNVLAAPVTATAPNAVAAGNETAITEPVNKFTVSSSASGAFTITPSSGASPASSLSSAVYNLDAYKLNQLATINVTNANVPTSTAGTTVLLTNLGVPGNYVTSTTNPLTITVKGYKGGAFQTQTFTFDNLPSAGSSNAFTIPGALFGNVTDVSLSYALPNPGVTASVYAVTNSVASNPAASLNPADSANVELASLTYQGPTLLYTPSTYTYYEAPNALSSTVNYGEEGYQLPFKLAEVANSASGTGRLIMYSYTIPEIAVPSSSTVDANVIIDLTNASTINQPAPLYWLNYSTSGSGKLTYQGTQNVQTGITAGFRTERGSELASLSSTSLTYDEATGVDTLAFLVGPSNQNVSSTTKLYGPYTVGQATNIPNVTIGAVNATCTFSATSCSVVGINSITATPSATQAVVAVPLNTALNPIAVEDSHANATNEIVIGSKYVNSVAAQIFAQNSQLNSTFGPTGPDSVIVNGYGTKILVAGYSSAQTVQAGNQFIEDLIANATQTT